MFREMRRKKQALSQERCIEILERGSHGVLAVDGDDGYPYAVPLSFHYEDGAVFFHCAKTGHKLDAIDRNEKASFCVVDQDEVIPEKYTTHYRSVIVFGRIHRIEDDAEKYAAVEKVAIKYAPNDTPENRKYEIEKDFAPLCMLRMDIDHMSGKEHLTLVKRRLAAEMQK